MGLLDDLLGGLNKSATIAGVSGDSIRTGRLSTDAGGLGALSSLLGGGSSSDLLGIGLNFLGDAQSNKDQNAQTAALNISPDAQKQLASLLGVGSNALTSNDYTKNAAIADSQGAVQQALNKVLQANLPKIYGGQAGTGAYSSTTAQLLQDNLFAEASGVGAKIQLDAINDYTQNRQRELEPLYKALGLETQLAGQRTEAYVKSAGETGKKSNSANNIKAAVGLAKFVLPKLFGIPL